MKTRLFPTVICVLVLALSASFAYAQDAAEDDPLEADGDVEPELTWADYGIKGYTVQIFGGAFNGAEYLNLPVLGDRTQVEEGSDWVMSYDGTWWEPDELDYEIYGGPVKTIENGYTFGVKFGSYLSDNFHIDLTFAYSATEAQLTMVNSDDPANEFREEIDRDTSIQIFRGAASMMYDIRSFSPLGIYPYFGFGFGGIINRFSNLSDTGGLYMIGSFGLQRHVAGTASLFLQYDMTTFPMSRDELHYTETVTYTDITFGISFFIDTIPSDVRALHESDLAAAERRR